MKVSELSIEEKLRLICGKDCWHTNDLNGKIPFLKVTDASMGVRMPANAEEWGGGDKPSVSYPSSQMLANTWNLQTVRAYAECVADDCLDYGADILLGPGVNIKRNPLCGRNFEYYSEDPYLAGVIAREYIAAMQAEGAGTCLKHFCCNNLEYNRKLQSSEVDVRTLREIYYKPFEIACEAKPVSVMCSYNKINGVQGSENKKGFSILRNEYGFDGAVISDWDAVYDRVKAAKAGLDLEMPFSKKNFERLVEDVRAGKISEAEIDECAQRVLDMIERCKKLQQGKKRKRTQAERIKLAQEAAEEGIVLLKNEGVLPLQKGQTLSACGLYGALYADGRDNSHLLAGGGSGKVVRLTKDFDIPEELRKAGFQVEYEVAFGDTAVNNSFMDPRKAIENAAVSDINLVFAGTGVNIETQAHEAERRAGTRDFRYGGGKPQHGGGAVRGRADRHERVDRRGRGGGVCGLLRRKGRGGSCKRAYGQGEPERQAFGNFPALLRGYARGKRLYGRHGNALRGGARRRLPLLRYLLRRRAVSLRARTELFGIRI